MSRIVAVRTRVVSRPLHTTFTTALRSTDTTDAVLVEVEDSDGVIGHGEAPIVPVVTGEDEPGIRAALTGPLRDAVLGAARTTWRTSSPGSPPRRRAGRRREPASTSPSTTWPLAGPAYRSPCSSGPRRRRAGATCPPT